MTQRLFLFIFTAFALTACTDTPSRNVHPAIAPTKFSHAATTSCEQNGGKAKMRQQKNSQQYHCTFDYGQIRSEWRKKG